MPTDDLTAIEEAIYDQSFHVLEEQARVLDGLRSRAGALAGVATVTTGVVGALASTARSEPNGALRWVAMALYVSVIVLSLVIFSPSRRWVVAHDPKRLLAVYLDPEDSSTLSEFRRTLAHYNGRSYELNDRQLARLSAWFVVASFVFVAELVFWLWSLST